MSLVMSLVMILVMTLVRVMSVGDTTLQNYIKPCQLMASSRDLLVQLLAHPIPLQHAVVPNSVDVVGSINETSSICEDRSIRSTLHLVLLPKVFHV
jgi:hypothetical protein